MVPGRQGRFLRRISFESIAILSVLFLFASTSFAAASATAQVKAKTTVFVENYGSNTISAIVGNMVVKTIKVGTGPYDQISYANETNTLWVTNSLGRTVSVINVSTDKIVKTLTGFRDPIAVEYGLWPYIPPLDRDICLEFIADYATNLLYVYNGTNYELLAKIVVGVNPSFIAYSPASDEVYVSNTDGHSVSVINWSTYQVVTTINLPGSNPKGMAYDPANKEMYVAGGSGGNVYAINSKNKIVATISGFDEPYNLAYNPALKEMYFTDEGTGLINLINSKNSVVGTVVGLSNATGIVYDPNGKLVYAADPSNNMVYPISNTTLGSPIEVGNTPIGEITN
jgi:YVTN family beta-propeller protein